jgi:hypothetical protein
MRTGSGRCGGFKVRSVDARAAGIADELGGVDETIAEAARDWLPFALNQAL